MTTKPSTLPLHLTRDELHAIRAEAILGQQPRRPGERLSPLHRRALHRVAEKCRLLINADSIDE
jgi:hypothetical protein